VIVLTMTTFSKPIEPMEARSVDRLPIGEVWQYEPKWDGFRCLLARDEAHVTLTSKSGQDLTRYFPELAQSAAQLPEVRFTLDGELVIPMGEDFSFDALLQRIHPAVSRVMRLSRETPAQFLAFDLLRRGELDVAQKFLPERRQELTAFAGHCFPGTLFRLSPASLNVEDADCWLNSAGGGSDGVIAKRRDVPYQSGNRDGMQKIKRYRSADCVIGGFRYGAQPVAGRRAVGSLLLGLYDDAGALHHVGFTSALKAEEKPALTGRLEAIVADHSFTGNMPGAPSRWSTKRSSEWTPVTPQLVVEASYDHFTGGRFRHGTTILRWRPDKNARQCTFDQLQQTFVSPQTLLR
jgi:ATP-dependent DNA ligase